MMVINQWFRIVFHRLLWEEYRVYALGEGIIHGKDKKQYKVSL